MLRLFPIFVPATCFTVVAFMVVAVFTPRSLDAQLVLLSDSFDRVEGFNDDPNNLENFSSWGENDNEFGGSLVQAYSMDTSRAGGAQSNTDGEVGIIRNGAIQLNVDFSTLAPNGYTVDFDFQRRSGNGFVTLGIGLDPATIPDGMGFNSNVFAFDQNATVDGAVLFQQDNENEGAGRVQVFNAAQSILSEPNAFSDNEDIHSASVSVVPSNGYGNGEIADVFVLVDGNAPIVSSITFDGENSGYLAFYSNQTGATIDNLIVRAIESEGLACDFDSNGACDLTDLDELLISGQSNQSATYDLNSDGTVDLVDRDVLLRQIERDDGVGSLPGDANLSGTNDASDLNVVGLNWQNSASSYSEGDFNGDGFVDAADLNELGIFWQQSAEDFVAANAALANLPISVPEPVSFSLLMILLPLLRKTARRGMHEHRSVSWPSRRRFGS